MYRMQRTIILALLIGLVGLFPAQAQDNLLSNPSFETNYSGRGRADFNFPENWGGWYVETPRTESWMNLPPNAYPHTSYFKYGGAAAQSIARGGATFTAGTYQEVFDIPAGAVIRGSAHIFIENAEGNNARVRIGVGSNVGSDPSGAITWSGWLTTLNEYQFISVDHTASGGSVTFFMYATQEFPNDPNAVYIDDASLVILSGGDDEATDTSGETGSVNIPAPQVNTLPEVGYVAPQDTQEDDGVTHTVTSGDTLMSIALAYGVPVDDILQLNGLSQGAYLQIGQVLTIIPPNPTPTVTSDGSTISVPTQQPTNTTEDTATTVPENTDDATTVAPVATSTTSSEPPTATPIPPAPVTEADTQVIDPLRSDASICVRVFEDNNQNGVLEPNELNVAGGVIALTDDANNDIANHITDGAEPFCFDNLAGGRYTLITLAPERYGLTTSSVLRVNIENGESIAVNIGAMQGLDVPIIPTVDTTSLTPEPETVVQDDGGNMLADYSGLIVLGLAGMVLVIGMGAAFLMRGR